MNSPASLLVIPAAPQATPAAILGPLTGPAAEQAAKSAIAKRAQQPLLPALFSVVALLPQLPLRFPSDPGAAPSPKRRYRSHYCYQGPGALLEAGKLDSMTDLEISLHLVDFSGLRAELAQSYRPSRKGQTPFDPVSLTLSLCLRREKKLGWTALSRLLKGEEGAGWRRLCGFAEGDTPSASGLRYFFQKVGPRFFEELCPRLTEMLGRHQLLPQQSTFPGDPPDRGVTMTQDGMLHEARSRPSCRLATEACYQPLVAAESSESAGQAPVPAADEAEAGAGRPCRARQKGLEGCACDSEACWGRCRRASRLDPAARFIHYDGNKGGRGEAGPTKAAGKGKDVFGYRSVADRVLDDRFAVAWTVRSQLYPANTDERAIFTAGLQALGARLPQLKIGEWLDDAAVGYGECLDALWAIGALRMVDIRADNGDHNFEVCLRRGYDDKGRPLCLFGYPMRANGYDWSRRRAKYVCSQVCRRESVRDQGPVAPVQGCPYLEEAHPLGQVVNLGHAFRDGSVRLAREIPYGSDSWHARYGRRNLSESRNGQLEGLGLKRMRSYGLERNQKEVQLADFLLNLRTLGRLVREASHCQRR